jgi:3-methylcrotonyl-CoA carboxylase alpha subunit
MSAFSTAPRPIRRVLVANRGEIACRIFRTCRRLGLSTVAVHSDADAGALHVREADEAIRIGPAAAAASYLDMDAIIGAAHASGADAIHPGYGFLSENAAFVRRCEDEGLIFIGPTSRAVAAMGSKIEAKRLAETAGVPTVPGYHGEDRSVAALARAAERIGRPLLVKASAGGGGRGMRLVAEGTDFEAALGAAQAEARLAFGDDAVLLERFIANPRHLEVQLVGDTHGNLVHLFERDCSIQRNNQKLIEEAPAPNLSDLARSRLFDAALKLGRAIGYVSAGTVEFVMEAGSDQPYFLEMNTRLQVEHPVTEEITGIDLVEWQLTVAAGLPLPLGQEGIVAKGHAIEARIAAERADQSYQPSVGRFRAVEVPGGLRLDTGISADSEIGLNYDSMIAKAIARGADRESARRRLVAGLERLVLLGPATNQAFLRDCLVSPEFVEGSATTAFLARRFPDGWTPSREALARLRGTAALAWLRSGASRHATPWHQRDGYRVMGACRPAVFELRVEDEYGPADVAVRSGGGVTQAVVDGHVVPLDGALPRHEIAGDTVAVADDALSINVRVTPAIDLALGSDVRSGPNGSLTSPLPGLVVSIAVGVGDDVEEGDILLQMEAMKLVHTVTAPHSGRVAAIHCAAGDTVAAGTVLVDIVREEEE